MTVRKLRGRFAAAGSPLRFFPPPQAANDTRRHSVTAQEKICFIGSAICFAGILRPVIRKTALRGNNGTEHVRPYGKCNKKTPIITHRQEKLPLPDGNLHNSCTSPCMNRSAAHRSRPTRCEARETAPSGLSSITVNESYMPMKAKTSTGFKLSVATLAIMNVTAVVSLRGLPAEAVYGPSSAFYYLFAAVVFLIPTALVAAELAAMFSDKQGGVFRWVGEAFGARTGFLAVWLQWIESTIWYPTVLTFGAVSIAFIGLNQQADAILASNKLFTLIMVLAIYWVATFISLKGIGWVGKISKWGGMVGTIIPAGLLIVLGIIYIATGGHNQMDMSQGFFPDLSKFDNLVLASSIFLFYAGMEMMGIHVMEVNNPAKNYPRAIIIGSLVTVCIFVLGTFSLGFIIPAKDISLTQSLLIGFDNYFKYLHMTWASPVIAVALMFGVLAGVLTWVAGPSKGIFAVGKAGYLPPFFQKANRNGVQRNILLMQGLLVTLLALLFVVMPSVQSFYQIGLSGSARETG